jgi:hypothetical protein
VRVGAVEEIDETEVAAVLHGVALAELRGRRQIKEEQVGKGLKQVWSFGLAVQLGARRRY